MTAIENGSSRGSVVIGIRWRPPVVEEVVRAQWRGDGLETKGILAEVETVREVVGTSVRIAQ